MNKISDIFSNVGVGVVTYADSVDTNTGVIGIKGITYMLSKNSYINETIVKYSRGRIPFIFDNNGKMRIVIDSKFESDLYLKLREEAELSVNSELVEIKNISQNNIKRIEEKYKHLDELRKSERYMVEVVLWISHKGKDSIDKFYNATFKEVGDGRILVTHEEGEALYEKDKFQRVYKKKYTDRQSDYCSHLM